jgi:NifU-like protein
MICTLKVLTERFPWTKYSDALRRKLKNLRSIGSFSGADTVARGMRGAEGSMGDREEGNLLTLYLLVDPEDGVIADAKFQAFGQSALLAAADIACELLIGKNYDQARRISAELIDQQVRDRQGEEAFPSEASPLLNMVVESIDKAVEGLTDIPLPESYVAPPVGGAGVIEGEGYPGFEELSLQKKLAVIEEVIAAEVRPYIELDAGGVEVLNLLHDREVIIAYTGACTSCFSATGATLSYIQQVLRAKVHEDLVVVPDMEVFT